MSTRSGTAWELHTGDAVAVLNRLAPLRAGALVTSPPYYGLRDYTGGHPDEYGKPSSGVRRWVDDVARTLEAARPHLRQDAVVWVNVGDTFNAYNANRGPTAGRLSQRRDDARPEHPRGLTDPTVRNKSLMAGPQRLAARLVDDGWVLRADVTWERTTVPERVRDRPRRHSERLLMLTVTDRYAGGLPADTTLHRDVWRLPAARGSHEHPARFNPALPLACLAWTPDAGVVLDPFSGSATTGHAALALGHRYVGIDLHDAFNAAAAAELEG